MIFFTQQQRVDQLIDLTITQKGKKTQIVTLKNIEAVTDRINQESARYYVAYLKDLFLNKLQLEDLNRQAQIIAALYNAISYSRAVSVLSAEIEYISSIEELNEEAVQCIQNCSKWLISLKISSNGSLPNVYEFKHNSITFEGEENRPSIESFLQNSKKN